MGLGTGMIINPEGYILTNNHVWVEPLRSKFYCLRSEYPAKLVGTDPKRIWVSSKLIALGLLPHVNFGDSDDLAVGSGW